MADYVMDRRGYEFTYSAKQQQEVEKIRNKYVVKEETKMEKLIRLDKQAERLGMKVSLAMGIIGSLIMGTGMSCVLVWNTSVKIFIAGILMGILGMGVAGCAYPVYKKITKKERAKIADQIIALSNELTV